MLLRLQRVSITAAALAVAGFFSVLTWKLPTLLLHVNGVLTRFEGVESKANATLVNLDKGTKAWADSAKQQTAAVEDLTTDAHGTLSEADAALRGVSNVAQHAAGTADAATGLLASAQRSTDAIPATLENFDDVLGSSRSLVLSGQRTNTDLQSLLESHAVNQSLQNIAGMTDSGTGILLDFRKVADRETAEWLKPVPWWKQPIKKAGDLIDIGAAVARHAP